jgi:hypothetical protein
MDSRGCPGGGTPRRDQRAQAGKGRMISAQGGEYVITTTIFSGAALSGAQRSRVVKPPAAIWGGLPISVSAEGGTDS